jgi:integrase
MPLYHLLEHPRAAIVTGSRDMSRDSIRSYPRSRRKRSLGTRTCPHPADRQPRAKPLGSIDVLPSGSLRVRVYAGQDVLTGTQHYISEVVKPGPHAQELAEQAKHRLVDEIHANRHIKTHASVAQLIEEHLKIAEIEETTKDAYRVNLRKHIKPQLPAGPAAVITAHTIEKFKAELRPLRRPLPG